MSFAPATITANTAASLIAQKPLIGGERLAYITASRARELGVITLNTGLTAVGGGITKLARSTNVATVTTTSAHGLVVGQKVDIDADAPHATFDGSAVTVASTPSSTTFTCTLAGADLTEEAATGTVNASACTWEANPVNTPLAAGEDLIAVVRSATGALGGAKNIIVTLAGTDPSSATIAAVGTFKSPAYTAVQQNIFEYGYAVDLAEPAAKKFAAITGATAYFAADAANVEIAILALPPLTDFKEVLAIENTPFTAGAPEALSLADKLDGTKWSKRGRSKPHTLTLSGKLISTAEGLMRFNGSTCTVWLKLRKEGTTVVDHLFFTEWQCEVSPGLGGGNDEGTVEATGMYEQLCMLPAI